MDWITIIGTLVLPLLAKCFQKTSAEDPQAVLRSHYDATTGKMDGDIVRECMPATRKAARKAHRQASRADRKTFPKLSEDQIYSITESRLIAAMNADETTVAGIMASATLIGDDE